LGSVKIQDVVGGFRVAKPGVVVIFNGHAAEYVVRRDDANIGRIVGALARSWAAQTTIDVTVSGTTIVGVTEE